MIRAAAPAALVLLLAARTAAAETADGPTEPTPTASGWEFTASVSGYLLRDERDYAQPTFIADRGWLHLEARYNYEDLETGSVWIGFNFSVGDEVTLEFTPMVGAVFGEQNGVAPGYELTLSWWKLELYTEGEFVFGTDDRSEDFFYNWSELSLAPVDWFRLGLVVQRTKTYETDFEVQRGLFAGFAYGPVRFTTYVFNPDDEPFVVLALSVEF